MTACSSKNNFLTVPKQEPMAQTPKKESPFLRKQQAADFLGISLSEFKRREKSGIYVASAREGHHRVYDRAYLQRRQKETGKYISRVDLLDAAARFKHETDQATYKTLNTSVAYDPETAIIVFTELEKDEDLVRIVKETKLHPTIVKSIHIDWMDLKRQSGGFHVSGESARVINALELDGFPVTCGEEIAVALSAIVSTTKPCSTCKKNPRRTATLCVPCERELIKKQQAL